MNRKLFSLLIAIYVFLNVIMPRLPDELTIYYFLTITCWLIVAFLTLKTSKKEVENLLTWRLNKTLILNALLIAALQIVILVFTGFFTAFGRTPYAFTPTALTINIAYFSSILIGSELSRAYLIKSCPKKKIFTGMALTSVFYTIISFPPTRFLTLSASAETAKFLGSNLLPTFAQSLLATYLALLGGPVASIAYLGTLEAFEWLCPILPNPPWAIKALITTLIPVIGFFSVSDSVSPFTLMRYGIISRAEIRSRIGKAKKSTGLSWIVIAVIGVILVWGSTGLLGFQPSIIASGSMRPTLDVGDIAIVVQTRPENIRVGDIIQYWRQGDPAPTIHRVIEVSRAGGITTIVTKGDANNSPDEPITVTQTVGKVILIIPKLGWLSIALKTAISMATSFIQNNPTVAIPLICLTLTYLAFRIHKYRSRPLNRLRGRLKG